MANKNKNKNRNKNRQPAGPLSPLDQRRNAVKDQIGKLFPDKAVRDAAMGSYNIYNTIFDPAFQDSQMMNYQVSQTDQATLDQMRNQAMNPEPRSAEAQQALDLLQQSATRQEFVSPELLNAFNTAQALAMGQQGNPLADAQREAMTFGLNQAMQTGLRQARGIGNAAGIQGGAQSLLARPVMQDFANQMRQGQLGLQLGNLDRFSALAGDVHNARESGRSNAINAYNQAVGQRESFEELRNQSRMAAYNELNQRTLDRYYTLRGADIARKDAYRTGELSSLYSGGSVEANRQAVQRSLELQEKMLGAGMAGMGSFGAEGSEEVWNQQQQSGSTGGAPNTKDFGISNIYGG